MTMPYIPQIRREKINSKLQELILAIKQLDDKELRDLDGDLNYSITKLILGVLELEEKPKYTKFNTAIGILESVKLELYRRFVAPYENEKILENGDI
jgi:hypothetical protein